MNLHDAKFDLVKVLLLNIGALGLTFTKVEQILKIIVLFATLSYTLWKWKNDYKKEKTEEEK